MLKSPARFAFLLTLLGLPACTPAPLAPTINYTGGGQALKTIGLLTPAVPLTYTLASLTPVTAAGNIGVLFGPVGGAIGGAYDASVQKGRTHGFTATLTAGHFQADQLLEQDITRQLQAKGYNVANVSTMRVEPDFLAIYPASNQPACDAYLDVIVAQVGYLTTTITAPYEPVLEMKYRLVRAGSGAVLMQGAFQYSLSRGDIQPDPQYGYPSYDQLASDPGTAITGLTAVLNQGAGQIAASLN